MKKFFTVLLLSCVAFFSYTQSISKPSLKILFIPLDDRPPCLQFTEQIGVIGNADVVTPPKELLGRFTVAGQSDKIIKWLKQQDLKSFQAAIISLDMLAYGGLVASRAYQNDTKTALERAFILRELRKSAPGLRIYAQNVIMRLAPTADGKNDAYRADLANWAEISVKNDDASKKETLLLEKKIPASALENYKKARQRNLALNLRAIEYVRAGIIDYLILSQDDAKPVGIHVADRVKLIAETKRLNLSDKIAVQPGADEVSMLLLARSLIHHYKVAPKVKAIYSSDVVANTVMPFEDKPLKETVSYHIKATGSQEVTNEDKANLLFYVFASRNVAGRAKSFAAEIEEKILQGKRVIVADIDPVGDVQGGDSTFTTELLKRRLFPELNSYASWNTAANTIGTTLPQGVAFFVAGEKLVTDKKFIDKIWTAQNWFTFHRVLDDYYFHGLNRSKINTYFNQHKLSSRILDDKTNEQLENYATQLLSQSFTELSNAYSERIPNSRQGNIACQKPSDFRFKLPWNRTFEAEINFDMRCSSQK
ncbi:MAG TPA: DUF4127 family protein [Chitinophagaceae bacterium]|nr:DUF4127 family protein [Chitinophagaceae bacterium]